MKIEFAIVWQSTYQGCFEGIPFVILHFFIDYSRNLLHTRTDTCMANLIGTKIANSVYVCKWGGWIEIHQLSICDVEIPLKVNSISLHKFIQQILQKPIERTEKTVYAYLLIFLYLIYVCHSFLKSYFLRLWKQMLK